MDLSQMVGSDAAILLFSMAGLVATTVAIVLDTKCQAAELTEEPLRTE